MKKKILGFLVASFSLSSVGCLTPQVQTSSGKPVVQKQYSYLREVISDRKISWAGSSYEYNYIPFNGYRTLLAVGENWGPTVNADLQRVCLELGGKSLAYEKDPLTNKEKPLIWANSWTFHWACVGGKDEFDVKIYRPNAYGLKYNLLNPIAPDWYIVIDHNKREPLIFPREMKALISKYKGKTWKEFFSLQKGGLWDAIWNNYGFLKALKLENGDWISYYDVERKGLASIWGRFYPIYQFAAYCYANNGDFVESDKNWIEFYKKKGLINTSFRCEGGNKPFLIKVEPYRIESGSISYKIYIKNLQ